MSGHDGHGHDHDGHDERGHEQDEHGHSHTEHDEHGHDDHDEHGHHAHDLATLGFGFVTVSSSRTLAEDPAGDAAADLIEGAGHAVAARRLAGDDREEIQATVSALVEDGDVDAVVTGGGTGVTPDDVTPEAVRPLLDRELPGFAELFRRLSYEEIGTMVVGTRAVGGIADGVPVFCLPGSENAVRLGVGEIVLEEAGHLAGLARRE